MLQRPRRNRKSLAIRNLVEENQLSLNDFIYPMFAISGENKKIEIQSMPNQFRWTTDKIIDEIGTCTELGINSFCLFPAIEDHLKNSLGTESYNPNGFYPTLIQKVKKVFPHIALMTDVALDPYSSDGHDGIVKNGEILNDETLEVLGKMALVQAQAGADIIGPSDMMDGRIAHIRSILDKNGYSNVSIMSYTAKYASAFYGPFRDALDSAPKFGNKKTYQMNPCNSREALIEAELDELEGADFLMIKPALSYLDIIKLIRENTSLPIAAYNVSGEYAMIKAAGQKGWIDEEATMLEVLTSIKRAGADIILSYFAKEVALLLKK